MLKILKISWLVGLTLLVLFHGNVFGSDDTGPVSIVGGGEVVNGNPVAHFYTDNYIGACSNSR